MADTKKIQPVLTHKFYTQPAPTFGVDRRAVERTPTAILKITSEFVGPFNKNWLYISALAYASMKPGETKLVPYQLDAVTVLEMDYDDNGNCFWTVAENLYDFRAWNMATKMIVSMSGAQYGGVADIIEVKGAANINSKYAYTDYIFSEGVHLIPMIPGRIITMSMNPVRMEVEFEIDPHMLFSFRRDETDNPEIYDYFGAFANACKTGDIHAAEFEWIGKI